MEEPPKNIVPQKDSKKNSNNSESFADMVKDAENRRNKSVMSTEFNISRQESAAEERRLMMEQLQQFRTQDEAGLD